MAATMQLCSQPCFDAVEEISSPQASGLRQLRRTRAFAPAVSSCATVAPKLASSATAVAGGLSQEELDSLCHYDAPAPVATPADQVTGLSQAELDNLCVFEAEGDLEELDSWQYLRRRGAELKPEMQLPEVLDQAALDELCICAEDGDHDTEELDSWQYLRRRGAELKPEMQLPEALDQAALDELCICAEDGDDDAEDLDSQLYNRRRGGGVREHKLAASGQQAALDAMCVEAEDDDDEELDTMLFNRRRGLATSESKAADAEQAALDALCIEEENAADAEDEDGFFWQLRRTRAFGEPADALALQQKAMAEASDASTETASCGSPSSSASDAPESPSNALLLVRRTRAFAGAAKANELVAKFAQLAEPKQAEFVSPAKATSKMASSPHSPVEELLLKVASPARRRSDTKESATATA